MRKFINSIPRFWLKLPDLIIVTSIFTFKNLNELVKYWTIEPVSIPSNATIAILCFYRALNTGVSFIAKFPSLLDWRIFPSPNIIFGAGIIFPSIFYEFEFIFTLRLENTSPSYKLFMFLTKLSISIFLASDVNLALSVIFLFLLSSKSSGIPVIKHNSGTKYVLIFVFFVLAKSRGCFKLFISILYRLL